MPVLPNLSSFAGRHYETGTLADALALQGVLAPHTARPVSEALLLGISGGITVGYFTFAYTGYPPHVSLLTRNTFAPFETILNRLAVVREVRQTTDAAKGERNLIALLEEGAAPIVWADAFSLPFVNAPHDERNWSPRPLLCVGLEAGHALLAAGSSRLLRVDRATFASARGRIKADRFRVMEVDAPNFDLLPEAVHKGIAQCIALYTEKPPRGKQENFGLAALEQWAKVLSEPRNRQSWAKQFPPGAALFQALIGTPWQPGVLGWIETWGTGDGADRATYASFLDEAAAILGKPDFQTVAQLFRASYNGWKLLADLVAPPGSPLRTAQTLLLERHRRFVQEGDARPEELRALDADLIALAAECAREFPLDAGACQSLLEALAEQVRTIHGLETEAVRALQAVLMA